MKSEGKVVPIHVMKKCIGELEE